MLLCDKEEIGLTQGLIFILATDVSHLLLVALHHLDEVAKQDPEEKGEE